MWKSLLAGTALLALAGSGLVLAQQSATEPRSPGQAMPSTGSSSDRAATDRTAADRTATDRQAYLEARIAALRAGLQLGPEQEKAWPAFERAYRGFVAMRAEMRDTMRSGRDLRDDDPMARLEQFADRASRRATALKDLADATGPLVRSLDDGQKRRFWSLARPLGPRFADAGRDRGPGGWHDGHHGRHHGHGDRDGGSRDGGYGRHGHHHHHGYGFGQGWSDRSERGHDGPGWRGLDRHGDDGYRRDGYGRGHGRGPDGRSDRGRSDDGPPWREGRRFDDDHRGGHGSGPPARRDDDRRRPSTGEERL